MDQEDAGVLTERNPIDDIKSIKRNAGLNWIKMARDRHSWKTEGLMSEDEDGQYKGR